jgi:DNA polymerase (family 10)
MEKREVADILREISVLLELKGESFFKSRAYENAARAVETLPESLDEAIADGTLEKTKGIGKSLLEKIQSLAAGETLDYYEDLKKEIPPGLIEMLHIHGLGPKKIKALHDTLGINTVGELEYACNENRLVDLPGFGKKTQENVLAGIAYLRSSAERFLFDFAEDSAKAILKRLEDSGSLDRVSVAGSLRRRRETIKDIDIVASTDDPNALMDFFASMPEVEKVIAKGETKTSVRLKTGISSDLRAVSEKEFPFALHHFTGSKLHNTAMRSRAKRMNLKMNEYGIFSDKKSLKFSDETQVFAALGLDYIPPELREDLGEIEAAESHNIPELIEADDLKGILHVHSDWTDAAATIDQMAEGAKKLGFSYIGMCDHSRTAGYAHGLEPERVIEQWEAIDRLNESSDGFTILKGIESDILFDGSLDYDDEILAGFDFVIGSVHSRFKMPEKEMTERIVRAMENPYFSLLGHPTGRLLLAREGYAVDIEAILEKASEIGVAIELNASPHRFDLDWRHLKKAKDLGVKICINPDAHHVEGLNDIYYGIGIARKGWLEKKDVVNCWNADQVLGYFKRLRSGKEAKR